MTDSIDIHENKKQFDKARMALLKAHEMDSIGDIDNQAITLQFESGAIGAVDVSRTAVFGYDISAEVMGSKGKLRIGYLRETPPAKQFQG